MRTIDELLTQAHPTKLFHYTGASGLLGIFKSGKIWASSSFHLNDTQEFPLCCGGLLWNASSHIFNAKDELWSEKDLAITESLSELTKRVQAYVASFSEQPDLLSQWLAYSVAGNGYSIGLSPEHFSHATNDDFTLVKCIYDEEQQIELADTIVRLLCESPSGGNDEEVKQILLACAAIKHPGFKSEAEWRLVKTLHTFWRMSKSVEFRQGRSLG